MHGLPTALARRRLKLVIIKDVLLFLSGAISAWVISLLLLYGFYISAADDVAFPLVGALVTMALLTASALGPNRFSRRARLGFGMGALAYGIAILLSAMSG
jgi:hypothetical protein